MLLVIGLVPGALIAAPYDGSAPLLCAVITVLECSPEGECHRGTAESVNIPQFVTVDVPQNVLRAADDTNRTSPITSREHFNGRMILQGAQGGRGWSMTIAEETGTMAASVVEDAVGFVIFGACTVR
jgi:hypothetical protein